MINHLRHSPEFLLITWGFVLNVAWEFLQSPLYTDTYIQSTSYLLICRFYCAAEDVLVLLFSHWITSALFRTRHWFVQRGALPSVLFVTWGLIFTAASEWVNTQLKHTWAYMPAMPTVFSVGLISLLQWIVVPIIVVMLLRRAQKRNAMQL